MADYTVSTNLISWIPAKHGLFGWPIDGHEAEVIRGMQRGDRIVPKFAQNPVWGGATGQEDYQRGIAAVWADDFDQHRHDYEAKVAWGEGAVPFVMRVLRQAGDDQRFPSYPPHPWACVEIEVEELDYPLSTSEFLKLRVVPVELAGQFKAMAAPNRHIQPLPDGAGATILEAGRNAERDFRYLRRECLIAAGDPARAIERLKQAGVTLSDGDRAFLVTRERMPGLHVCDAQHQLEPTGEEINVRPSELRPLLEEAAAKAVKSDYFRPARALHAAKELAEFLDSEEPQRDIDEFSHFHDRYVILSRKVTEALDIRKRPTPVQPPAPPDPEPDVDDDDENDPPEQLDLEKLQGLTVEAVEKYLDGIVLPRSVLAEAVTALRSGKHLLLSGPPGTGKSTVASALCKAVVESRYRVTTATADWTTFDTVGGYVPEAGGALEFEPGLVLRSLDNGQWLVIDELNRADIDKAFGPLFTLLAGAGADGRETVVLPFRQNGKNVDIGWAATAAEAKTRYVLTPSWRLLGTMNISDKASLFQLSFAFLRRFAVVDVPLPEPGQYRTLFESRVQQLPAGDRDAITDAAMAVAFGPVPLGPAILLDIAAFTDRALVTTAAGSAPFDDPVEAFLTAVRLYAVPQYEGAAPGQIENFSSLLQAVWPAPPTAAWAALVQALNSVALIG